MSQVSNTTDRIDRRLPRVLQIAFACDPDDSMETRIGWYRARLAAQQLDVTVLTGPNSDISKLNQTAKAIGLEDRLHFHQVEYSWRSKLLSQSATTYYLGLHAWHKRAYQQAKQLHNNKPFDLVHQTTYCGYREPGYGWKLGAPFIWGPVGGTQSFPREYLSQLSIKAAWIEVCRNAINAWQLRYSRRVRKTISHSSKVVAATQQAHDDLLRTQGIKTDIQIETALDFLPMETRASRNLNKPIRLLWAGRLKAWKSLPLLLKALANLPKEVPFELRILGQGDQEIAWKRQAHKLLAAKEANGCQVQWLGWPEYRETLQQYAWADAFVFTSMRDTSGTGLHEALAFGTPIIGMDHQGAADIMTDECALKIPVTSPADSIYAIQQSIKLLSNDPELWNRLSAGALREAQSCTWDSQAETMHQWYAEVLAQSASFASNQSMATHSSESTSSVVDWKSISSVNQSNSQMIPS